MHELFLFFQAWWFPILIMVVLSLFWLSGKFIAAKSEECFHCFGSGKQWVEAHDSYDLQTVNCEYCEGTGKKPKKET